MGGKHAAPRPATVRTAAASGAVTMGLALGGTALGATTSSAAPAPGRVAGTVTAEAVALAPTITVNGIAIDPTFAATYTAHRADLGNPTGPSRAYGAGKIQAFQRGAIFARSRTTGATVYATWGWIWTSWQAYEHAGQSFGLPLGNPGSSSGIGYYQLFDRGGLFLRVGGTPIGIDPMFYPTWRAYGGLHGIGWPAANKSTDKVANYTQRMKSGERLVYAPRTGVMARIHPRLGARIDALGGTRVLGALQSPQTVGRCAIVSVKFANRTVSSRTDGRWCPAAGYAQPTTSMHSVPSGYDVSMGWGSGKVNAVTKALGLPWEYDNYGYTEANAVKAFQARKGLPVTGVVNKSTWDLMGTGWSWYIDGWHTPVVSSTNASRAQHVEQMIRFAQSQVGAKYIFGGTGPAALGYACSGIIYQSMISAGVDPYPMTWVNTAAPNSWGNQAIYRNWSRWQHVPVSQAKRGDLVFWDVNRDGYTEHVGLYLGNGQVLDSIYVKGKRYGVGYTTLQQSYFGMPLASYAVRVVGDDVA